MKDKYVAYYYETGELEMFDTHEEAEKWLIEYDSQDGISEGSIEGKNWIAKITHRSQYEITDEKEYYHEHTDDCPEDCDEEEWPYASEFDTVGIIKYLPVDEGEE